MSSPDPLSGALHDLLATLERHSGEPGYWRLLCELSLYVDAEKARLHQEHPVNGWLSHPVEKETADVRE